MKVKRSILEKVIKEELVKHFKNLMEAPDQDVEKETGDEANDRKKSKVDKIPEPKKPAPAAPPAPGQPGQDEEEPAEEKPEVPDEKDPADDELEADDDNEGDDDRGSSSVADELAGKTVQSITMEPKSKVVPGAQEIVITFNEITDPLKILVTKTGAVKFFFRGLHDSL